jgi:hypothetical protein
MDRPTASARNFEGLGNNLTQWPMQKLISMDHRDSQVTCAISVVTGVCEIGNADLYDVMRIEASLNQPANRRTIAATIAQIVVRIERNESALVQ